MSTEYPPPRGAFSRVRAVSLGTGKILFVSGLTSAGQAPFDIKKQSELIFQRMEQLLAEYGAGLADVIKITTFLTDMREYDGYNQIRNQVFSKFASPPASTSVGITLLNPETRVEVEAIAVLQGTNQS
jgi:enamine deaminase RidA (YjgF/YER057c/UK114 family)